MTTAEANRLAERLKGSLPTMTDQQVLDCAKKFDQFARTSVEHAIERYLLEKDEYSLPRLMMMIREEKEKAHANTISTRQLSYIDTLRATAMAANPAKAAKIKEMKKEELAMRVGRGWWLSCSKPLIEGNHDGEHVTAWTHRAAAIIREVRQMLISECDAEDDSAEDYGRACVADEATYQEWLQSTMQQPELIPT